MEQCTLKYINSCWKTKINFYIETKEKYLQICVCRNVTEIADVQHDRTKVQFFLFDVDDEVEEFRRPSDLGDWREDEGLVVGILKLLCSTTKPRKSDIGRGNFFRLEKYF